MLSVGFVWVTQERVGKGMWYTQEVKDKIMNLQIEFQVVKMFFMMITKTLTNKDISRKGMDV